MMPLLHDGDVALVVHQSQITMGSICVFELPDGHLAAHRVISVNRDNSFVLKGDRTGMTETVERNAIIGLVTAISVAPHNGEWLSIPHAASLRYAAVFLSKGLVASSPESHTSLRRCLRLVDRRILYCLNWLTRLYMTRR